MKKRRPPVKYIKIKQSTIFRAIILFLIMSACIIYLAISLYCQEIDTQKDMDATFTKYKNMKPGLYLCELFPKTI